MFLKKDVKRVYSGQIDKCQVNMYTNSDKFGHSCQISWIVKEIL